MILFDRLILEPLFNENAFFCVLCFERLCCIMSLIKNVCSIITHSIRITNYSTRLKWYMNHMVVCFQKYIYLTLTVFITLAGIKDWIYSECHCYLSIIKTVRHHTLRIWEIQ